MRLERVVSIVINMVYIIFPTLYNVVKAKMRLKRLDLITKRFFTSVASLHRIYYSHANTYTLLTCTYVLVSMVYMFNPL